MHNVSMFIYIEFKQTKTQLNPSKRNQKEIILR